MGKQSCKNSSISLTAKKKSLIHFSHKNFKDFIPALLFNIKTILFKIKYEFIKKITNPDKCEFKIFVLTKFNVNIKYSSYRNKLIEENKNINIDEKYLEKRFEMFEKYYLPSLAAQSDKNFKFVVFFNDKTPLKFKEKVEQYKAAYKNFIPVYVNNIRNNDYARIIKDNLDGKKWFVTIRLDNDDAISVDFVEKIRKLFCPIDGMYINFANGVTFDEENKVLYNIYKISGHYLAYIEKLSGKIKTAYSYSHDKVSTKFFNFLNIETPDLPMWFEAIHGYNVLNIIRDKEHIADLNVLFERFNINLKEN